jgi:hypothetical protein
LPIADGNGEPAKIAVSDLAEIVGAETVGDHRNVGWVQPIGQGKGDAWICLGTIIRHMRDILHASGERQITSKPREPT